MLYYVLKLFNKAVKAFYDITYLIIAFFWKALGKISVSACYGSYRILYLKNIYKLKGKSRYARYTESWFKIIKPNQLEVDSV